MKTFVMLVALVATGCMRNTTFECSTDQQCAGAGQQAACDPTEKLCTVFDSGCAGSMRRYADHSGPRSGECVGGGTPIDMGMGNENMGGEPQPMGCPGNYIPFPANEGGRGHRYFVIEPTRPWTAQRDACAAMNTFLAFPDGPMAAAELAALKALPNAGDGIWVGVNDQLTEGSYRTSLNMPVSATTMALIDDNDGGSQNEDCLYIKGTTLDDDSCNTQRKAVCECVP